MERLLLCERMQTYATVCKRIRRCALLFRTHIRQLHEHTHPTHVMCARASLATSSAHVPLCCPPYLARSFSYNDDKSNPSISELMSQVRRCIACSDSDRLVSMQPAYSQHAPPPQKKAGDACLPISVGRALLCHRATIGTRRRLAAFPLTPCPSGPITLSLSTILTLCPYAPIPLSQALTEGWQYTEGWIDMVKVGGRSRMKVRKRCYCVLAKQRGISHVRGFLA